MKKVSTISLRPLGDRVIVQPDSAPMTTASGIVLSDSNHEKPTTGVIVAVGPGQINSHTGVVIPVTVSVGDRVLYSQYSPDTVKHDGIEYAVLREESILAIIS